MDLKLAVRFAELSLLSYLSQGEVIATLAPGADVRWLGDDGEPMIVRERGYTVIVHRGTRAGGTSPVVSWEDIREDLEAVPIDWRSGGKVSVGFAEGVLKVKDELLAVLDGPGPIYVTGHSLGAARATLTATLRPSVVAVYNFGSPRAADRQFWRYLQPPLYRFVHGHDAVPKVPLPPLFWHGGDRWHVSDNGSLIQSEAVCPDWMPGWPRRDLKDHQVAKYVASLKEALSHEQDPARHLWHLGYGGPGALQCA